MNDFKLTASQSNAVNSKGLVVLKSCPGSGKTFVVANKMIIELKDWKAKNQGVAMLSFTNVAYKELINRIKELTEIEKLDYPHFCGTIDGFLTQYLFMPFGNLIMNCKTRPSVIQDYKINLDEFSRRMWRSSCYKNGCDPLDFYFNSDGIFCKSGKTVLNCDVRTKKPCLTFSEYRYKNGYATHNDVIAISLRVLKEYPEIGKLLAKKFPMLIVDEAQDTSSEQMKIIDELNKCGISNIMLIGDPDQAIYEWRDADPSVFLEKYNSTNWVSKDLNENFRCSQNICNATHSFSSLTAISESMSDTSTEEFIPQVVKYNKERKDELVEYFLDICRKKNIDITPKNVAVLVRGRSGLIGKDYSQIKKLWQTQITKLLTEATFERDTNSIPRAVALVSKALCQMYIDNTLISNEIDFEIIDAVMNRDKWNEMVNSFCKELPLASTPLKQWDIDIKRLIKKHAKQFELEVLNESAIKIKTRDKKYPDFKEQPITNFYIKSIEYDYQNATIHSVKGCTFKAVLLIVSSHGKLTSNVINSKPVDSEEIRTAYVAMTRAKQVMIVAVPNTIKKKSLVRFNTGYWDIRL